MRSLINYILPQRCVNCSRILSQDTMPLCLECYQRLPLTHWKLDQSNPTYSAIYDTANIVNATSLLIYLTDNMVKKLIMANKYYNQKNIGAFFAQLAYPILEGQEFDAITCIPSHPRTQRFRGYNQVEIFARQIASNQDVDYNSHLIKRKKRRDSQTHKNKVQRFKSLDQAFLVSDQISTVDRLLLVDDVLTTGATLSSCCKSLLLKHPQLEISVLTMAKVI